VVSVLSADLEISQPEPLLLLVASIVHNRLDAAQCLVYHFRIDGGEYCYCKSEHRRHEVPPAGGESLLFLLQTAGVT